MSAAGILDYLLKNCQEPKCGFNCWGEHLGWDLLRNAPGGNPSTGPDTDMIHEFYRPWIQRERHCAHTKRSSRICFDQTTGGEERRLAHGRTDELQTGDRNV